MSFDKIFDMFSSFDEDDSYVKDPAFDFTETPIFHLGMFKKLIWNQKNFVSKMNKFRTQFPNSNILDDEEAGEFVTFNRAWFYISKFDIDHPQAKDAIRIFSDIYTKTACDLAINFFEEREEYERCAHIKKIADILEVNLEA